MDFLPIFINIKGRHCLVAGGGEIAARKVSLLLRAQGQVMVVAPELCATLNAMLDDKQISYRKGSFDESDILGCDMVIAATNDMDVNERVYDVACRRNIQINVVDQPEMCSFIFPAIVDRSPVVVAVSTGGASPVLARILRARLETLIPAGYGRLADLVAGFRNEVKKRLPDSQARRRFWEKVLQGPVAEMIYSGREKEAIATLRHVIESNDGQIHSSGEVYLVGAGPGDPDLLTFRALRLRQQADVVLYDRLVTPEILDLVRREAERVYVGKKRAYHSVRQEEINRTLVRLAKEGKRVLRLKGGDPFIFGRGGEEIATLAQENVPFQIVPGITAASGCASYAGIPLTHRDYAQSVLFVTGYTRDGATELDWARLIQPQQTIVIYMGTLGLENICKQMITYGMHHTMPAAMIEQGTTPNQRVIVGTVGTLPEIVSGIEIHAPTLVIVGEVVRLHETLGWYRPAEIS